METHPIVTLLETLRRQALALRNPILSPQELEQTRSRFVANLLSLGVEIDQANKLARETKLLVA